MNTKKFKSKLAKITIVFESMQVDQSISALEQELLKKYVIQLYETLLESQSVHKPKSHSKVETTPESLHKQQDVTPVQNVKSAPIQLVENNEVIEIPAVPTPNPEPLAQVANTVPAVQNSAAVSEVVVNKLSMPKELAPIFERVEALELSDRLGNSKVSDISTAMGINEKIFTIKELFGGDQNLFATVTSKINACGTYEEAVDFLSSTIARDKKWGDRNRAGKAKVFMKLVQRKFA